MVQGSEGHEEKFHVDTASLPSWNTQSETEVLEFSLPYCTSASSQLQQRAAGACLLRGASGATQTMRVPG